MIIQSRSMKQERELDDLTLKDHIFVTHTHTDLSSKMFEVQRNHFHF